MHTLYLSRQRRSVLGGAAQTRWCWKKDQRQKGGGGGELSWCKKTGIFAERYRTGAVWLESVSSSSVHQLQYTHSDDAWKSIYATSRERRQHREGEGEKKIQRMDWRINGFILVVSGQNQTSEEVEFHSQSQFTFRLVKWCRQDLGQSETLKDRLTNC